MSLIVKSILMSNLSYIDQVKELGFSAAPVIQTPTEVFSGFQPGKLKQLA